MSLNPDGRENKIKLISDTMTGFYSVMRNLQEDYKTYSKNYSEEALALLFAQPANRRAVSSESTDENRG